MWQHYYGAEPWDALDTVIASLGQKSVADLPPPSMEETPEQIEARIMQEMGIS